MKKALLIILNLVLLALYPISYYRLQEQEYEAKWSQPMSDAEVRIAWIEFQRTHSG